MRSISKRLTLRIMMVVLAMIAVIASIVYFTVGEYMEEEAKQRFQIGVMRTHREIQRRLSDVYVANINSLHEIERDIDNPDKLPDHLERIVRLNPGIVSCGLLFIPDYYPEKGKFYVPFATRDTADVVSVMRIDDVYHDYFGEDWYVDRMKSNTADWVDPYFENPLLTTRYRLELPSLSFFSRSFTCPLWTLAVFFFAIVFSRFRDYHRFMFRGTLFLSPGDSFCTFDVISGDIWGTKLGKNLQIDNTQIKNLQTTEQTLTLENKRFTAVYLQILYFSLQWVHFPTHHRQSIEYQRSVN